MLDMMAAEGLKYEGNEQGECERLSQWNLVPGDGRKALSLPLREGAAISRLGLCSLRAHKIDLMSEVIAMRSS